MRRKRLLIAGIAIGVVAAGATAGMTVASDSDEPITGPARDGAIQAAIAYLGGGTATDTEVGDEEGAYEVEVRREDGTSVDVHLDENFVVISTESDTDETED